MRAALLTPMRLLSGIAFLTVICMLTVALVTDHLADIFLSTSPLGQSSRIHLINNVTGALQHAQDDRRAYLATGNVSFLNSYRAACADVDTSMERLVSQDNEVSEKLAHPQGFRAFLHAKLSAIAHALEAKKGPAPVMTVSAAGVPKVAKAAPESISEIDADLSRIQKLLDALGVEETRDISNQLEAAQAHSTFHRSLVVALAAINILFLAGVGFCAIQIGKLHNLVTMCAWSKKVEFEGKWIPLEEYVRKRFGVRISHGMSQEEYEKWKVPGMDDVSVEDEDIDPHHLNTTPMPDRRAVPKAAA